VKLSGYIQVLNIEGGWYLPESAIASEGGGTGGAGPAGPQGPKGDTGPAGPQGPPGVDGSGGGDGSNALPLTGGTLTGALTIGSIAKNLLWLHSNAGGQVLFRMDDPGGNDYAALSSVMASFNDASGCSSMLTSTKLSFGGPLPYFNITLDGANGFILTDNSTADSIQLKPNSLILQNGAGSNSFNNATLYQDETTGDLFVSVGPSGSPVNIRITDFTNNGLAGGGGGGGGGGVTDAPTDGGLYGRASGAWQLIPLGKSSQVISYTYNITTLSPPSARQIRFNAPPPVATLLWISHYDSDGVDVTDNLTRALENGGKLVLQDETTKTNYANYTINGDPTDNGTWTEVPVACTASGGSYANNLPFLLFFGLAEDASLPLTGGTLTGDVTLAGSGTGPTVLLQQWGINLQAVPGGAGPNAYLAPGTLDANNSATGDTGHFEANKLALGNVTAIASHEPITLYQDTGGDLFVLAGLTGAAVPIQITDFANSRLAGVGGTVAATTAQPGAGVTLISPDGNSTVILSLGNNGEIEATASAGPNAGKSVNLSAGAWA
jgi:hypothetical protein